MIPAGREDLVNELPKIRSVVARIIVSESEKKQQKFGGFSV